MNLSTHTTLVITFWILFIKYPSITRVDKLVGKHLRTQMTTIHCLSSDLDSWQRNSYDNLLQKQTKQTKFASAPKVSSAHWNLLEKALQQSNVASDHTNLIAWLFSAWHTGGKAHLLITMWTLEWPPVGRTS